MIDFKALVGTSVQVEFTVEKIVVSGHSGDEMILVNDVYVNGEFFRDHSWIKMTKRLSVVSAGDKVSSTAILMDYFDTNTNKKYKVGFRSFRNVKICNKNL